MNIRYEEFNREFSEDEIEEIINLYVDANWSNYTINIEMLKSAYKNSLYIVKAYRDSELVGIIRIVGDGFSIIYIQDLIVKENYQRQGIGKNLINLALDKYKNVYQKVLLTEDIDKNRRFYESLGLKESSEYQCISYVKFK